MKSLPPMGPEDMGPRLNAALLVKAHLTEAAQACRGAREVVSRYIHAVRADGGKETPIIGLQARTAAAQHALVAEQALIAAWRLMGDLT